MGSAGVGFVPNKKTVRMKLRDMLSKPSRACGVFCERVYQLVQTLPHPPKFREFFTPKIRTLARFLSGALAAGCGIDSLLDARWMQWPNFREYTKRLSPTLRERLNTRLVLWRRS